MTDVKGVKLDPDEIAVGVAAAKRVIGKMTYMGVNVGSHVTEAEYNELVLAIVGDIEGWRNADQI
jgi:hypothetical protein